MPSRGSNYLGTCDEKYNLTGCGIEGCCGIQWPAQRRFKLDLATNPKESMALLFSLIATGGRRRVYYDGGNDLRKRLGR